MLVMMLLCYCVNINTCVSLYYHAITLMSVSWEPHCQDDINDDMEYPHLVLCFQIRHKKSHSKLIVPSNTFVSASTSLSVC